MSEKQQHHFSISHNDLCDLRAVFCSASDPEMFKSLERQDSGKIELDMQQVCERIAKAALLAFPLSDGLYNCVSSEQWLCLAIH